MNEETLQLDGLFADDWDGYNARQNNDESPASNKYAHRRLPNTYPPLPDFGILCLSVASATALIVRDMQARNRPPFDDLIADIPGYAGELAKVQEELIPKVREHLVRAIEKGRLSTVSPPNSYQQFVEFGDQSDHSSSHIFYEDLVDWLRNSGYEDSRALTLGPAFEAYEQQEFNLGQSIEQYIKRGRERSGMHERESRDQRVDLSDAYADYLYDALQNSGEVIKDLKNRLNCFPNAPASEHLQTKEQDTLFVFVNSLLKLVEKKGRVKSIQQQAEELGQKISPNTIRKWVKEAEKRS